MTMAICACGAKITDHTTYRQQKVQGKWKRVVHRKVWIHLEGGVDKGLSDIGHTAEPDEKLTRRSKAKRR